MSQYNTINAMGIKNIDNISHHTLVTKESNDILKIYFKPSDDVTAADSLVFCFERHESDERAPTLLSALDELSQLINQQTTAQHRNRLLNELEKLELVMASKLDEMRQNVSQF